MAVVGDQSLMAAGALRLMAVVHPTETRARSEKLMFEVFQRLCLLFAVKWFVYLSLVVDRILCLVHYWL